MSKINLRIISKSHAHYQSMVKTSAKFQKNRNKTEGGVARTMYILLGGRKDGRTESQKLCTFAFLPKGEGQK